MVFGSSSPISSGLSGAGSNAIITRMRVSQTDPHRLFLDNPTYREAGYY